MPKKITKSGTILKLINRKSGATLTQLVKAIGVADAQCPFGAYRIAQTGNYNRTSKEHLRRNAQPINGEVEL